MKKRPGFSLAELLIVVIVIGILAAVGVSGYRRAVERTRIVKAKHHLTLISQALKMCRRYSADANVYIVQDDELGSVMCDARALNSFLELNAVDADSDWVYTGSLVAYGMSVTAARQAGNYEGKHIMLEDGRNWGGNHPLL